MRNTFRQLLAWRHFETAVLCLIILNSITLALETSPAAMENAGDFLHFIDKVFLTLFVFELIVRLVSDFKGFWKDPWRIFDFFVVAIALLPATGPLAVLRALRILRVLRLISAVPAMRRVVSGLLGAMPGMASIVFLIGIIFFVFSVISTKLFGATFPEWFGSLGESAYTLFQIMTLESWSMGIVRPVMDEFPLAWILFLPFIIITSFTVLNLFIGVIVDAMQTENEAAASEERNRMMTTNENMLNEIRGLRQDIDSLRSQVASKNG